MTGGERKWPPSKEECPDCWVAFDNGTFVWNQVHVQNLHAELQSLRSREEALTTLLRELGLYWGWEDTDPVEGPFHARFKALVENRAALTDTKGGGA